MTFPVKDWRNGEAGGTKLNAEALEDLELRLSDYTDTTVGGGDIPIDARLDTLEARATRRVSVQEWAPGVGLTDYALNTAAVRGIAAAVKAAGGGIVTIPFADYGVDCASNTPLENTPGAIVTYEGLSANGLAAGAIGSRVRRAAGTLDVAAFVGTGNSGTARARGGWRNLEIDGGAVNARIVRLAYVNELDIPYLRVIGGDTDNVDYGGVELEQCWNTGIGKLRLYRCGGTSTPALNLKGKAGDANPPCDSLSILDAKWEACKGTELKATAPGGGFAHGSVMFGHVNIERQLPAMTQKVFDLLDIELFISNLVVKLSPADGNSIIWTQNSSDGVAIPHCYIGSGFLSHGGTAVSHFIEVLSGYLLWGERKLRMIGTPSTAAGGTGRYLKIGSGVGLGRVGPGRPVVSDETKLVSDGRTYGSSEAFGARSIRGQLIPDPAGGSALVAFNSGKTAGVSLSGTADEKLYANFAAPGDAAAYGSGTAIRVRGTIDGAAGSGGADTMRFSVELHKVSAGTAYSGGTAAVAATSSAVPAVLGMREILFTTGTTIQRGDEITLILNRLAASDAADNYPGRFVVTSIDLVIDR